MPKKIAKIIYDHREEVSQIPANLVLLEIETESVQLTIGDYIISEEIVVERKSGSDFAQSVIDGRLFEQVSRLIESYPKPILIVEGSVPLKKAARQGAIISVIKKGVSVLTVQDSDETVEILNRLALSEIKEGRGPVVRNKPKKKNDPEETAIHSLSMIPGISYKKAKQLLEEFGSIKKITSLEKEDLKSIEGIGPKTADLIWNTLNFDFRAGDDIFR